MTDHPELLPWEQVPFDVVATLSQRKTAAMAPLQPLAQIIESPQHLLGGPNSLTKTLVGGLVGAGLGHVGGRIAGSFLPAEQFYTPDDPEGGRLRRNLTLAGAALGAAPGLYSASVQARTPDASGNPKGLLAGVFQPLPSAFQKTSLAAGGDFVTSIPVDAFNRVVWAGTSRVPSAFGTRDPFGTRDTPLMTPPPVAAFTSGLVAGTGAVTGQTHVSPWQVGLAAARTAGVGYSAGLGFGRLLGGLAGLRPETQTALQQTGLWAGLLTGGVRQLLQ
jgi:hypothetical protein